MAKPLDGLALQMYFRRLGLRKDAQELLICVRSSPPNRTPGAHRGNMPVWYPSKKMQCIIKAESHKVEFAFLLAVEHDDDVLEFWDQPPPIPLEYPDRRGRIQRPLHTADYFVFRSHSAGWVECKPTRELVRQAESRPHRYQLDEQGTWRCPPGEAFAAKAGLTYQVFASDTINWVAQSNWQFLEDYHQDLEQLSIPDEAREILCHLVDDHPGISLSALRREASGVGSDLVNIAIAKQMLYVDLATYRLCEPERTPVFRDRMRARAHCHRDEGLVDLGVDAHPILLTPGAWALWDGQRWQIANAGQQEITLVAETGKPFALSRSAFEILVKSGKIVGLQTEIRSSIAPEGQEILAQATDVDLATAVFRNRVINPHQYDDEEQEQTKASRAAVPVRTRYARASSVSGGGNALRQWFHRTASSLPQLRRGQTVAAGVASPHRRSAHHTLPYRDQKAQKGSIR